MDTTEIKVGGWLKDQDDHRDYRFAAVAEELKQRVSNQSAAYSIPEYTPISDQGGLSSCVGNSTTDALEILMGVQNPNSVIQLSRLVTYWIARLLTNDQDKDAGTYIRAAFSQIASLGVCPETVWPYDENKVLVSPPLEAYEIGNSNKITSFYRIDSFDTQRLDDIELAVRANHPVVFGTTVGLDVMQYTSGVVHRETRPKGGHAIICVGVRRSVADRREFLIRNSWGAGYGMNGHVWFDEDFMTWDQTNDLWVPTLMPKLVL